MSKLIIDVREPAEFASGHVDGAINIPPSHLLGDIHELDGVAKDTKLVLYCRTGSRSAVAIEILKAKGFTNLDNGINIRHVESRYI